MTTMTPGQYEQYETQREDAAINEIVGALQSPALPTWAKKPLAVGMSKETDSYELYLLIADMNLVVLLMSSANDDLINGWLEADIKDWMRMALVDFKLASDRWSKNRKMGDAEHVQNLLALRQGFDI